MQMLMVCAGFPALLVTVLELTRNKAVCTQKILVPLMILKKCSEERNFLVFFAFIC